LPRQKVHNQTAHAVHFIICSFLGHELPQVYVHKKGHTPYKATPTPNPLEEITKQAMLAKLGKKKVEEIKAADKAAYKERNSKKINVVI